MSPTKAKKASSPARTAATRTVLVAEDSATQAERVRLLLEGAGYRVQVVADGDAGLDALREGASDLIISDVLMPGLDGYQFCRSVKSSPATRHIPFVLLTEHRTAADIIRGLEHGADNFITKPFEDEYLLERVERIFEHLEHRKGGHFEMEVAIRVAGREVVLNADKQQIIELLFATSEELADANFQLAESKRLVEEHARTLEERVRERTRQLSEAEARYRTLVERVPAGVYRATLDGRILECNDAFARIYGYSSRQEMLGQNLTMLFPAPEARQEFLARLTKHGSLLGEESQGRRKEGTPVWVLENVSLVRPPDAETLLEGAVVDVTERKHLEEQLRQAQKLEAIGSLAGGIAHDFNNLLGVILGFGGMALRDLPADSPVRTRLEKMVAAADRGASLTRQLLAFSRKQAFDLRVLDLNDIIAEFAKLLPRLLGEDVGLDLRLDESLAGVKADRGQIEQVLMNLAVNARDAMPRGGRLTIETTNAELDSAYADTHAGHPEGSFVLLAVSDTGCGMDRETLARVFEPFFTTKPLGKGTGLGLATVYGIVKQSGGYIWVYSEPDRGTTFKIYLPRVEGPPEAAIPLAPPTTSRGSETILVVEDEETLLEVTRELLEANGYRVLATNDAESALEMAERHPGPIQLLITDVVMPTMNGRELARRIFARRPELKVLYVSGYTDNAIVHHGVLGPGTALLSKPFTEQTLTRKVREVLQSEAKP